MYRVCWELRDALRTRTVCLALTVMYVLEIMSILTLKSKSSNYAMHLHEKTCGDENIRGPSFLLGMVYFHVVTLNAHFV